jgi:MFS family permease
LLARVTPIRPPRFHPAWVIVAIGNLCILACLGFGRFALGMLLPSMAATLRLSYAQIGYVGTGNFVGYLAAVLLCGPVAARLGARRLIFAALVLMAGSMLLIARAGSYHQVLVLYLVTGIGSGAVNVPVMGLVARWFTRSVRGRAAGFVVVGSGFAIIVSGWLIPFVNRWRGPEGWRTSWLVLGLAVLSVALLALLLVRDRPEDRGLAPFGNPPGAASSSPATPPAAGRFPPAVVLLGLAYSLFGFTYVIYATFIVTTMVRERGFSERIAGSFWSTLGLLSLVSGPVFGALSDRLGRRVGLAIVFSIQAVAYALVAAPLPAAALYLSVALFGVVAWAVPSIMLAAVSDHVGPERAVGAFGLVTFVFGLGQIAGPAVAGILADRTGSFRSSFALAAALAGAAIVLTAWLKKPGEAVQGDRAALVGGP